MEKGQEVKEKDPFRGDAALVYRYIRDHPGCTAPEIRDLCFGFVTDGPASSVLALQKRGLQRVYDSIVWMRHQKVDIYARNVPDALTTFSIGAPAVTDEVSQGDLGLVGDGIQEMYHPK